MSESPREVFDRFIAAITDGRWSELADFYAEDAVVDQPMFAPDRVRIVGRDAVRQRFAAAATGPLRLRPANVVVHTTGDPEVVIAEFDYEAEHTGTGRRSTVANVQLMRVRAGQIVQTRDYHDHLRLAAVAGRAAQLAATLE